MTKNKNSKRIMAYLESARSIWYWITLIIAATTAILVYAVPINFYPWTYLRNILGLLFVFFLPGFTFIKIVFPKKMLSEGMESLEVLTRIALGIGISIALVSILGLILYYTPFGLNLTPMVFSLFAFIVILATAGAIKESRKTT